MSDINAAWPVLLSILGFVVWLVRLEGRINANDNSITQAQKDVDTLRVKHEALDSEMMKELSRIRESLARIEGRLLADKGE